MDQGELPTFRYHPDPVATGSFEPMRTPCRACGSSRGWVYVAVPYSETDLRDALCPWCIADGSAAAAFSARFTDLEPADVPAGVPAAVIEEITRRTPGFAGWDRERWLFHCDDGAEYLGAVGWSEVAERPDAMADLEAEARARGLSARRARMFLRDLNPDGGSTAYLFRCRHCDRHLAYADQDDD